MSTSVLANPEHGFRLFQSLAEASVFGSLVQELKLSNMQLKLKLFGGFDTVRREKIFSRYHLPFGMAGTKPSPYRGARHPGLIDCGPVRLYRQ